ncbi:MAG: hypothetical protein HGN29_04245 [Asgard group archaeon]|nr:hypothetical protein [Asgard group archaeon]
MNIQNVKESHDHILFKLSSAGLTSLESRIKGMFDTYEEMRIISIT